MDSLSVTPGLPRAHALWRDGGGARYSRVSAVLVATFLHPWSLSDSLPTLWTNSAAVLPLDCRLPLPAWTEHSGVIVFAQAAVTAEAAVGLLPGWKQPDV